LFVGHTPQPSVAMDLRLEDDWTVWQGFVAVARNCLEQLYSNEVAVLASDDPEAIHQLRVAVRRLRAAFTAFGSALSGPEITQSRDDLRWLQRSLGPARDWDVFIRETLVPLRRELPGDHSLTALAAKASAAHAAALEGARTTLKSQRYALFQLRFEQWLRATPTESGTTASHPVSQLRFEHWLGTAGGDRSGDSLVDFARDTMRRRDLKLRRSARDIGTRSREKLHATRIFAKKCRYCAEFFRSLYGRKAMRKYLRRLRRFQDSLGALNDAVVATRLVADLALEDRSVEAILTGWYAARISAGVEQSCDLWEDFARADRPWDD
jgi:CHAD domain-containing protein